MSISSEITRISGNVSDALAAIANKGVTVPSGSNSDDLATLIAQITGGGGAGAVYQDANGYVVLDDDAPYTQTINITTNGDHNVSGYGTAHVAVSSSPNLQAKTNISPTTSSQTITADNGYDGLSSVQINAMPSGTAGTPSASKGTVSNHSVSVTPSVTNTTGYITGGTKTGTAVTVTASELASGNKEITQNGTNIDVVGYSTVSVNVSGGGGGGGAQISTKTATLSSAATSISFTNLSGEPTSFAVTANANTSTGGTAVTEVIWDGTNFYGSTLTSQVAGSTSFSKSYFNGTLTITATGATFSAMEYKLVYSYGGSSSNVGSDGNYVGSGATSITFNNVSEEPSYFACVFSGNFSTSSGYQRVIGVVYDGTSTYGLAMDSAAKPQTSWSYSYSNGSLTITSQGTNNGGYFHADGTVQYRLVYGVEDASPYQKINKTYYASTTAQSEKIEASTGYDAIGEVNVSIPAVSQTNLTAANIKSGTTVTISNGSTNLWSVTGTYSGGGSGGANFATATMTNSNNQATSIEFTLPSGRTPIAFFARLTSQIARNSSSRYYYVFDMRWDGSTTGGVAGNTFYMYNGTLTNVTSGYGYSQDGTAFTLTTTGSRSASPGSFYNGTYELVYVY